MRDGPPRRLRPTGRARAGRGERLSVRGVILDLDGTVCLGDALLPGARQAVEFLRRKGLPWLFLSNTLDHPQVFAERLTRLGLPTSPAEIVNAPMAVLRYLDRHAPGARLFVIGLPPLAEQLAVAHRLTDDPQEVDAVVVSVDYEFDYRKLEIAFQALRRGARFLATNLDRTWPTPDGEVPDTGAMLGAIEACTRRKVDAVVGKPSAWMAELALQRLGSPADQTWVVGDSLESDVQLGRQAGMTTALVLTGVTHPEDLDRAAVRPDFVLDSLGDLPALLDAEL